MNKLCYIEKGGIYRAWSMQIR